MKERFYLVKIGNTGDVKELYNTKVYTESELFNELFTKNPKAERYFDRTIHYKGYIEEVQLYVWQIFDNVYVYSVCGDIPYLVEIDMAGFKKTTPDVHYFDVPKMGIYV